MVGSLILVAPIASVFELARFPLDLLGPIGLAPLAVLLADTAQKWLVWGNIWCRRPSGPSASGPKPRKWKFRRICASFSTSNRQSSVETQWGVTSRDFRLGSKRD